MKSIAFAALLGAVTAIRLEAEQHEQNGTLRDRSGVHINQNGELVDENGAVLDNKAIHCYEDYVDPDGEPDPTWPESGQCRVYSETDFKGFHADFGLKNGAATTFTFNNYFPNKTTWVGRIKAIRCAPNVGASLFINSETNIIDEEATYLGVGAGGHNAVIDYSGMINWYNARPSLSLAPLTPVTSEMFDTLVIYPAENPYSVTVQGAQPPRVIGTIYDLVACCGKSRWGLTTQEVTQTHCNNSDDARFGLNNIASYVDDAWGSGSKIKSLHILANQEMRFDIFSAASPFDGYTFREFQQQNGFCVDLSTNIRGLAEEDANTAYVEKRDPTNVSFRELHWPSSV